MADIILDENSDLNDVLSSLIWNLNTLDIICQNIKTNDTSFFSSITEEEQNVFKSGSKFIEKLLNYFELFECPPFLFQTNVTDDEEDDEDVILCHEFVRKLNFISDLFDQYEFNILLAEIAKWDQEKLSILRESVDIFTKARDIIYDNASIRTRVKNKKVTLDLNINESNLELIRLAEEKEIQEVHRLLTIHNYIEGTYNVSTNDNSTNQNVPETPTLNSQDSVENSSPVKQTPNQTTLNSPTPQQSQSPNTKSPSKQGNNLNFSYGGNLSTVSKVSTVAKTLPKSSPRKRPSPNTMMPKLPNSYQQPHEQFRQPHQQPRNQFPNKPFTFPPLNLPQPPIEQFMRTNQAYNYYDAYRASPRNPNFPQQQYQQPMTNTLNPPQGNFSNSSYGQQDPLPQPKQQQNPEIVRYGRNGTVWTQRSLLPNPAPNYYPHQYNPQPNPYARPDLPNFNYYMNNSPPLIPHLARNQYKGNNNQNNNKEIGGKKWNKRNQSVTGTIQSNSSGKVKNDAVNKTTTVNETITVNNTSTVNKTTPDNKIKPDNKIAPGNKTTPEASPDTTR